MFYKYYGSNKLFKYDKNHSTMKEYIGIHDLKEGDHAIVRDCDHHRLLEYGFVEGTHVQVYKKLDGITCISARGAIIASRDSEWAQVKFEPHKLYKKTF